MKFSRVVILLLLASFSLQAFAQTPSTPDGAIVSAVMMSLAKMAPQLRATGTVWLSALMTLQFVITNYKLLLGDSSIEMVFAKFIGSVLWFCVCWYIMTNAPALITSVGNSVLGQYQSYFPSVTSILLSTAALIASLTSVAVAVGLASQTLGKILIYAIIVVLVLGAGMAIKLILLEIELGIVACTAPISFAFLGMNALRDQGIAPFKALITLMYRILVFAVIAEAYSGVNVVQVAVAQHYAGLSNIWTAIKSTGTFMTAIGGAMMAQVILIGLLFKSDSIASNLASGSTSLGASDVTGAAMAGAAAGAAIGNAVNSATNSAQGIKSLMRESLMRGGSGVDVKNASGIGRGGSEMGLLKPDPVSHSLGPDGGHAKESPDGGQGEFRGSQNPLPDEKQRDPARDAAREARRQARRRENGSGQDAGIGGALANSKSSNLRDHFDRFHQHLAQEKVATHVSINPHQD